MFNILYIRGEGVKIIIPCMILAEIESRISESYGGKTVKLIIY